jgi:hypothetical protein
MKVKTQFSFDVGKDVDVYYALLNEEDFEFKTKQISLTLEKQGSVILVTISAQSFIDCKIAVSAVLKSVEIIEKTKEV